MTGPQHLADGGQPPGESHSPEPAPPPHERSHPDPETLASLAEGRLPPRDELPIHEHLAHCRTCMAAYADAVRYRAAWLARPEAFEPDPRLIELGRGVASPTGPRQCTTPTRRHVARRSLLVAGAMASVAVVWLAWKRVEFSAEPAASPALQAALEASSARGLVLPGGVRGADRELPGLRSGLGDYPELLREIERGVAEGGGGRDREASFGVAAGLLVTGQLSAARDYVARGMERFPRDPRFRVLAADLAYRESDLPLAEQRLREALELRPGYALARLDLGIVFAERGARDDATRAFDEIIRHQGGTALGRRAQRERTRL